MCNDYEQHIAYQAYVGLMQAEALKVRSENDLAWRTADDVRIGDAGPAVRIAEDGVAEVVAMRFGWPAQTPKAGPVFNFRSEGRRFGDSRRCLIPASAFFEFTGAKSPKTKHRFTLADERPFCVAGLWKPCEGNQPDAFTMLTTAPGPDVAPIHARQIVVLPPGAWRTWLVLNRPEADILRALPARSLKVETVWTGHAK
jgi:putative SOS response-associated peptidase YedK